MAWTPPSDAIETSQWTPPADAASTVATEAPSNVPSPSFAASYNTPVVGPAGMLEAALSTASGMGSSAIGGLGGIVASMFGGGLEAGADVVRKVQEAGTYQPRTEAGKYAVGLINKPMELASQVTGAAGKYVGGMLGNEAAGQAIGEVVPAVAGAVAGLKAPIKSIATSPYTGVGMAAPSEMLAAARSAAQRGEDIASIPRISKAIEAFPQNAHKIEAAVAAKELGIKINPAESNPTAAAKIKSTMAGGKSAVDAATALENLKVNVPNVARKELGIPENTIITKEVFNGILEQAGKPAEAIKQIPLIVDDGTVAAQINKLRPGKVVGKGASRDAVNSFLDEVLTDIEGGISGKEAIAAIQQHRRDARQTLSKSDLSVIERDKAKATLGVANAMETLVENKLARDNNLQLLRDYKAGRQLQAKAYTWMDAWNADTGIFDPKVIGKQTAGDSAITGDTAKIGKIANNFPGAMKEPSSAGLQAYVDAAKTHMSKMGPLGVAGGLIGGAVSGGAGAGIGATLGMAAGELLSPFMRKKLISAANQEANVVPAVSSLMSPLKEKPVGTAVVPYVTPTDVILPSEMPNWTTRMGKESPVSQGAETIVTPVGPDMSIPQLGYRTAKEAVLEKEAARSEAARAAYEAQAAAEKSVPRKVTGAGVQFDLDPITGRLVPTSQGVKGATPEMFQVNTGANLKSASEKVAAGKTFDLTAAEKVAWEKTVVDIKEINADFSKLSSKQIASKMSDRQWVTEAIDKAKQKAELFNKIAERSNDRAAQSIARINREKMMDLAEQLQDKLGSRPSSRGYEQGAKTRAFQRGLFSDIQQ